MGKRTIFGVRCQQGWSELGHIESVLRELQPKSVVEIGTGTGALSCYLKMYSLLAGATFRTFDITVKRMTPRVRVVLEDSFECRDAWKPSSAYHIGYTLVRPVLFLLDGGNKPREAAIYAPLLQPGDVMMIHDYGEEWGASELPEAMRTGVTVKRSRWYRIDF